MEADRLLVIEFIDREFIRQQFRLQESYRRYRPERQPVDRLAVLKPGQHRGSR